MVTRPRRRSSAVGGGCRRLERDAPSAGAALGAVLAEAAAARQSPTRVLELGVAVAEERAGLSSGSSCSSAAAASACALQRRVELHDRVTASGLAAAARRRARRLGRVLRDDSRSAWTAEGSTPSQAPRARRATPTALGGVRRGGVGVGRRVRRPSVGLPAGARVGGGGIPRGRREGGGDRGDRSPSRRRDAPARRPRPAAHARGGDGAERDVERHRVLAHDERRGRRRVRRVGGEGEVRLRGERLDSASTACAALAQSIADATRAACVRSTPCSAEAQYFPSSSCFIACAARRRAQSRRPRCRGGRRAAHRRTPDGAAQAVELRAARKVDRARVQPEAHHLLGQLVDRPRLQVAPRHVRQGAPPPSTASGAS